MTWAVVYDSNTGSDFAPTAGPVGAGQILVNGWKDVSGNIWSTASGNLQAIGTGSPAYVNSLLVRPSGESTTDQRMLITLPAGALSTGTSVSIIALLRCSGQGGNSLTGYLVYLDYQATPNVILYRLDANNGLHQLGSTQTFSYNNSHSYSLDASITGTTLAVTVTDVTGSSVVVNNYTQTDATYASGQQGLAIGYANSGGTAGTHVEASRVQTYKPQSLTLSPTQGEFNSAVAVTATGFGTSWTSGTTFSATGGTGASVDTNSVNVGAQTANITIHTGTASGTLTIGDSTDALTASFVVAAAVNDQGFYWSPNNWYLNGSSYALTNCVGAYFIFQFTGTSATLLFDTSALGSNALYLRVSVDGGAFVDTNISGTSSLSLCSGLANTAHTIVCYYRGSTATVDGWNTPTIGLKITGMQMSSGATTAAPATKSKNMLVYGDSRVCGWNILSNASTAAAQDATSALAFALAQAFNAELGVKAFPGSDLTTVGTTNIPGVYIPNDDADSSWNKYFSGQNLLVNGQFPTPPDYIFILDMGVNGRAVAQGTYQAAAQGFLTALRAAAPSAKIIAMQGSVDGYQATAWLNAWSAYQLATPDGACYLLPLNLGLSASEISALDINNSSATYLTTDGNHTDRYGTDLLKAHLVQAVQQKLSPAGAAIIGS